MSMVLALETALKSQEWGSLDTATVQLARRYAWDLDEAELVSVAADKLLREVQTWMEPALYDRIKALFARIERTKVLGELGPKLLVTMVELSMSPRARADTTRRGGVTGGTTQSPKDPLAKLRAERATRLGRQAGGGNPS